jgi:hypothetical protein
MACPSGSVTASSFFLRKWYSTHELFCSTTIPHLFHDSIKIRAVGIEQSYGAVCVATFSVCRILVSVVSGLHRCFFHEQHHKVFA